MSGAQSADPLRAEAARLGFALIRFLGPAAHLMPGTSPPGAPIVGNGAWLFGPSWRPTAGDQVETLLIELPGPALIQATLARGQFVVTLLDELKGDRRKWAEKTVSNLLACLDGAVTHLDLSPSSRVLLEFDDEAHVFSLAAVRYWAGQFPVEVGWNLRRLENDPAADACLMLLAPGRREFPGRSCMVRGRGDRSAK